MIPPSPNQPGPASGKRTVYLPDRAWEMASRKAAELNLSTSRFLSRLVAETSGVIGLGPMLGLDPLASAASGPDGRPLANPNPATSKP